MQYLFIVEYKQKIIIQSSIYKRQIRKGIKTAKELSKYIVKVIYF